MPRGGPRNGRQQKSYPNRTDLNGAKALPATAVPGQEYGKAAAQLASQRIVPMASGPLNPAPLATGNAGAVQSGQSPTPVPTAAPGTLGDLTDPTTRPGEHFLSGVNTGPGPGSEALMPLLPASPAQSVLSLLNTLGDQVSSQVEYVRTMLALQTQNQMPH